MAATNLGLREAVGDWACFLHQDDLWLPGRLERLRTEMESDARRAHHSQCDVCGSGRTRTRTLDLPIFRRRRTSNQFIERLLVQNFIAIPSPVFRRNAVIDSGGLDEALWFSADWDLWLRLGALGPVRFIDETLSAFRVHPASQTAARKLQANEWEQQLTTVLARHLESWPVTGKLRTSVERVAMASIAVNSALSAASRGEPVKPAAVLLQLLTLSPSDWHRYLRDSRIVQRVRSRLKLRRLAKSKTLS